MRRRPRTRGQAPGRGPWRWFKRWPTFQGPGEHAPGPCGLRRGGPPPVGDHPPRRPLARRGCRQPVPLCPLGTRPGRAADGTRDRGAGGPGRSSCGPPGPGPNSPRRPPRRCSLNPFRHPPRQGHQGARDQRPGRHGGPGPAPQCPARRGGVPVIGMGHGWEFRLRDGWLSLLRCWLAMARLGWRCRSTVVPRRRADRVDRGVAAGSVDRPRRRAAAPARRGARMADPGPDGGAPLARGPRPCVIGPACPVGGQRSSGARPRARPARLVRVRGPEPDSPRGAAGAWLALRLGWQAVAKRPLRLRLGACTSQPGPVRRPSEERRAPRPVGHHPVRDVDRMLVRGPRQGGPPAAVVAFAEWHSRCPSFGHRAPHHQRQGWRPRRRPSSRQEPLPGPSRCSAMNVESGGRPW